MRVLILSLGHPDRSPGGTERGSYSLYRRLAADSRVRSVVFATPSEGSSGSAGSGQACEIAVTVPALHPFVFGSKDRARLEEAIGGLMRQHRPDVVHVHHFIGWGIDVIGFVASHGVPCVLTVHDYALLCAHYGQLLTTDGRLCSGPTPVACNRCFPKVEPDLFARRETYLRDAVSAAAAIITPSAFARDRLIDWGIEATRVTVIENLLPAELLKAAPGGLAKTRRLTGPVVVGFFGQVTPFKGLDVLLRAAAELGDIANLELRIHGANRAYKGAPFQRKIDRLAETPAVRRLVHFHDEYRNAEVLDLMRACDSVVVPSIWWENSPLVIREAKLAGCRIICSDLGGMREKTTMPPDHRFPAGDYRALAAVLRAVAAGPGLDLGARRAQVEAVLRGDAAAFERHLRAYFKVISGGASRHFGRIDRQPKF